MRSIISIFVSTTMFLSPIAQAKPINCGEILAQKSPHTIGPQLAIMNTVADKYFEKIGLEMNPLSRAVFYHQVRGMKPSDSVKAFGEILESCGWLEERNIAA